MPWAHILQQAFSGSSARSDNQQQKDMRLGESTKLARSGSGARSNGNTFQSQWDGHLPTVLLGYPAFLRSFVPVFGRQRCLFASRGHMWVGVMSANERNEKGPNATSKCQKWLHGSATRPSRRTWRIRHGANVGYQSLGLSLSPNATKFGPPRRSDICCIRCRKSP